MNDLNDNQQRPPIQLLITACATADDPGRRLSWLHGYCLLTLRPANGIVLLDGDVRIGDRYADNFDLIQNLADALDPDAVLAGLDLTDTVSRLGRLPVDARQQGPALALLGKLKAMLEKHLPLELTLNETSQTEVAGQALKHLLSFRENLGDEDRLRIIAGTDVGCGRDNGNPHRLAIELADTASACILAVAELYLEDELQPKMLTAWQAWKQRLGKQNTSATL